MQEQIFPTVEEPAPVETEQATQTQVGEQANGESDADKPSATLLAQAIDETIKLEQQRIQTEEDKFRWKQRLARMFCEAGTFEGWEEKKQNLTPHQRIAQAMVKIMLGEACGMTPIESMQSIYLVKGRPTLDAQVRAARMKRFGYSWVIVQLNEKGCVLIPCHRNNPPYKLPNGASILPFTDERGEPVTISFVESDAKQAGLLPGKDESNWKKYPTDMFFARAITRMQRRYAPEVLNGANLLDRNEAEEQAVVEELLGPKRPVIQKKESEQVA